jgi:hypothetical protein
MIWCLRDFVPERDARLGELGVLARGPLAFGFELVGVADARTTRQLYCHVSHLAV